MEGNGRKGVFLRNDQYHNKFNGGGHKCCDPSVSFTGGDWQSLPDRGEVYVFTLTELEEIKASHAKERNTADCGGECHADCEEITMTPCELSEKLVAARGEGAASRQGIIDYLNGVVDTLGQAMWTNPNNEGIDDIMEAASEEYNEWQQEGTHHKSAPDTTYTETRKEERAKVLEEVAEAVIPKGCHVEGCPLTKAQRTAKKSLAQDKE